MEKEGSKPNVLRAPNALAALLNSTKNVTGDRSGCQLASNIKMSTKDNCGKVIIWCSYNLSAIFKH